MAGTQIGEYMVGAFLKTVLKCDIIDYNARPPGGGIKGLEELDVIGLDFKSKTAYLCEVTTHILGLKYGGNVATVNRIRKKYNRQKEYARKYLKNFKTKHYMLWSPVVSEGYITQKLGRLRKLDLVINDDYTACMDILKVEARNLTNDTGNPFFRVLQILEHLR